MKKTIGIIGIICMFLSISLITPAMQIDNNEGTDQSQQLFNWKIIIALGRINVCFEENVIDGIVLIGYIAGEVTTLVPISIEFEGRPIIFSNGLLFTCILYKTADYEN